MPKSFLKTRSFKTWLIACLPTALLLAGFTLVYADTPRASVSPISAQALTFPANPLLSPANGTIVANPQPRLDWVDAQPPVISYTLVITGPANTRLITTTASVYTPTLWANGAYTWTVQAHNAPQASGFVTPPATFTLDTVWQVFLPYVEQSPPPPPGCPTTSANTWYVAIPFTGARADRPDYLHADLNLSLRGYEPTSATLGLVDYSGSTDTDAPQLAGLFEPNAFPGISAVYRVYDWNWGCGGPGCRGPLLNDFSVTLAGLITTPDQPVYIPERSANIYQSVYKALVLYAEEKRITLKYTREDNVVSGYTVHLENVCVDPNLLALYRAQVDAGGWHVTGQLPALRHNQPLGTAFGAEIRAAIRDNGTFMDPRSRKDWWKGY